MTPDAGDGLSRFARGGLVGACLLVLAVAALVLLPGPGLPTAEQPRPAAAPSPVARVAPGEPVRLVIPAIDVRARVVPIEMNRKGVLHPPDDVDRVGWWRRSAQPGAAEGQTMLTGHTVSSGGGVMDELGTLTRGDRVTVRTSEGRHVYRTTKVFDYTRAQVARNAHALFGQDRQHGRLVLVTCTDWDGEVYRSNTIVFAEPVRAG